MMRRTLSKDWLAWTLISLSAVVLLTSVFLTVVGTKSQDTVVLLVQAVAIIGVGLLIAYLLYQVSTRWPQGWTYERIVISQIAAVVRQNLPLATGLALAAESEQGRPRLQLRHIARLVAGGMTLSEAVRTGFPNCSAMTLGLVAAGEQTGQLSVALDQAEERLFERDRDRPPDDVPAWSYLLVVTGFAALIVSGIMVAVVPKFKEIFLDFDVVLPLSTRSLIRVSEFFADLGWLLIVLIVVLSVAVYLSLRPRRRPRLAFTSRIADWIRWHTPAWRQVEMSRGMRSILQAMRLGVRSGMSLEPAMRVAEVVDVNDQLKKRLERFRSLVDRGVDLHQAAHQAGLGEVAAVAMAAGKRGGDLDAALRYAADYYSAVASRWWILLRNISWPIGTLVLGVIVGFIVVALFQPLVALINSVAM